MRFKGKHTQTRLAAKQNGEKPARVPANAAAFRTVRARKMSKPAGIRDGFTPQAEGSGEAGTKKAEEHAIQETPPPPIATVKILKTLTLYC